MSLSTTTRPLILGNFAVYAQDLQIAQEVYALVFSRMQTQAFGTVVLDTGDEVDWVDMTYDIIHSRPAS